ncbi:MAG: hypothetical protein KKB50_12480 [Planctomycetes bacterium]|nr:hypothetical protein [Planctomycetota bacterium]
MLSRFWTAILTAIFLAAAAPGQTTWYVDDDAPNDPGPGDPTVSDPDENGSPDHPFDAIQDGIDAAVDGDEVVVLDGTYTGVGNRDLDFGGKAITGRSASGDPSTCIIDCENSGRGFYFHSGETLNTVVDSFKITNGSAGDGAGIYCYHSSPTFKSCAFESNSAYDGAGMYNYSGSSPLLIDCTFDGNTATNYGGGIFNDNGCNPTLVDCRFSANSGIGAGGMANTHSSPTLTNCTFSENLATGGHAADGAGMFNWECSPTLTNCSFSGNGADRTGGGMCTYSGSPTLTNCTFSDNAATDGGGMYSDWGSSGPTLINCTFVGNSAANYGGGMYNFVASPTLVNCMFSGNAALKGGGMYNIDYPGVVPAITNCTLSGNAADSGAAIFCGYSIATITNCILWGDTPEEIHVDSGSPVVTYCDVQGGWSGTGNIDDDPLLVDPANDDYHLAASSPCIDTGDPNFVAAPDETDMDGEYRLWDGDSVLGARVDMGADEFGSYRYGDLNCDGTVNGFDIDAFVAALKGPAYYDPVYPDCDLVLADINADGAVNGFDIDPFIALLIGG